ncbi:MAG: hypothetical protein ACD_42C00508G0003 [uncultured bacterium]|nr:MAG: hypothetical protein ACD_42C00508G0003 [uncultured bacterium]OGT34512.1 MAG: hypothetical protein A3C44_08125 [Gammaproteobacteria bacterium RIFCSPHIGHO2_02_FULL_39_13]OGT50574.1 MAG: hypothetical protein A3E53_03540 [Gammaproteobacteria bacterium RIFCSPHIGHO2_12_FULL_39_24]
MATKTVYKHILIAADLSEHSDYIAKRALEIAKCVKAKLSIVHVMAHAITPYAGEFSIPIDAELEANLKKEAKKRLTKIGKKYHIAQNAQYLTEGSIKSAVTQLAKKIKADLIIVGTHGREGLELLIGSQANGILHAAQCDVWVIRIR